MFSLHHVQVAMPPGGEGEARVFYHEIVGLAEVEKPDSLKPRGGVWFKLGDRELHLGVEDPFRPAAKAHPGIHCRDLDALAARLEAAGAPLEWDDRLPGYRRFYTQDPFGNRLEFLTERDA